MNVRFAEDLDVVAETGDEENEAQQNAKEPTNTASISTEEAISEEDARLLATTGLSAAELQELKEIFQLVDQDHGGTISKEELGVLMMTLGLRASKAELETMINEIDSQGTGEIDFEAFVGAMSRKVQSNITADDLRKSFRAFDDHGDGTISMTTLIKILTDYGDEDSRLTKEQAQELVSQVASQQAQSGLFDYSLFIQMYGQTEAKQSTEAKT